MRRSLRAAALLMALCLLLACIPGAAFAGEQTENRIELQVMTSGGAAAIAEGDLTIDGTPVLRVPNQRLYVGDQATLELSVSGGEEPYTFTYRLCRKTEAGEYVQIEGTEVTTQSCEYSFTVPDVDCFRIEADITDAAGATLLLALNDMEPDAALVRKVESVVAEYAPDGLSDYSKAFNLHNWLCENASYDYTYTWYTPDGVLLYGTGVCDSFAQAYMLLLDEAGIDNRKVVGSDMNGESHAWVLVKLGGEWYHMDPTWDEASSHRFYFGLNTALITRDHIIDTAASGGSVPETTATAYNYEMNRADGVFSDVSELETLLGALPEDGDEFEFYYTGSLSADELVEWCASNAGAYGVRTVSAEGSANATFLIAGTYEKTDETPGGDSGEEPGEGEMGFVVTTEGELVSTFGLTGVVEIPGDAGITSIGEGAFEGCDQMTGVVVPASVRTVADGAFRNCTALETAVFSEGVAEIGADVFSGCCALKSVTIPESVTSIDGNIVSGLDAGISCHNGSYAMRWAVRYDLNYTLINGGTIMYLPGWLEEIEAGAFEGDRSAQCVFAGDSLKMVGSRAFADCTGLISINLPASVTSIADDAFTGCSNVTVYCEADSYAHSWCVSNTVKYVAE